MKKILSILIIMGALLLSSCESSNNSESQAIGTLEPVPAEYVGKTNPLNADAATDGAKVFKSNCEACHGPQAHGDGPSGQALDPRPQNLAVLQAVATDDYLFWRISDGKFGTSMIGWKGVMTEEQIWQVITFLHTLE
jgi:mono/diheme cytochrome c family protein